MADVATEKSEENASGQEKAPASLTGPSGVDLNPGVKNPVRMRKAIGLILVGLAAVLISLMGYGIMSRGKKAVLQKEEDHRKGLTAASSAEVKGIFEREARAKGQEAGSTARGSGSGAGTVPGAEAPDLIVKGKPFSSRDPRDTMRRPLEAGGSPRREETPEDKYRAKMNELYEQALVSGTSIGHRDSGMSSSNTGAGANGSPLAELLSRAGSQLAGLQGSGTSAAAALASAAKEDPNMQGEKEEFGKGNADGAKTYLGSSRVPALSQYEIKAGWDIPAVLEQAINSDLPGEVRALVRENVYDTASGRFLLIPQGSRLVGIYSSHIAYGQSRVQVVWNRLIYPDGTSLALGSMSGQDEGGQTGFHDQVNRHYLRLVSMALLTSAFSAGVELSQKQNTSTLSPPTTGQVASQALGQQLGELGREITRQNLSVQPTLTIRMGYRFNVRVNKDIAFASPYADPRGEFQ